MATEKKSKRLIYALCVLVGLYSADMVYRLVRYLTPMFGESPLVGTILAIINDADSFMLCGTVVSATVSVLAFVSKSVRKRTLACFIFNTLTATAFLVTLNVKGVPWKVFLYSAPALLPAYIVSGLWCIYLGIKDLYISLGEKL